MNTLKKKIKQLGFILNLSGFDFHTFFSFLKGFPSYLRDFKELKKQMKSSSDFQKVRFYPILHEKNDESGIMKGNYFHQDLLIARKIFENKPERHLDIGSRIDGFVAHVASFRQIDIMDIRPQKSAVKNMTFYQADLTQFTENNKACSDSISSLHAIEHFGLGRYGDRIDLNGHVKALKNIHLMLKPNGKFYFSVPIGEQRIEFNGQRVFSLTYLISILSGSFTIDNFNYVDENGNLFENAILSKQSIESNFNCNYYGCGIFELTKIDH